MSGSKFHARIARLIEGIEALDSESVDDGLEPYMSGPIPLHLDGTHVGDLAQIDAGLWIYEEVTS